MDVCQSLQGQAGKPRTGGCAWNYLEAITWKHGSLLWNEWVIGLSSLQYASESEDKLAAINAELVICYT